MFEIFRDFVFLFILYIFLFLSLSFILDLALVLALALALALALDLFRPVSSCNDLQSARQPKKRYTIIDDTKYLKYYEHWTVLKKSNKIGNHTAVRSTWQQTGKTSMFEMLWQMKTIHQIRSNHAPCLSFFTFFTWHKSEKSKEMLCNSKVFGKILLYEENKQRNVSC